MPTPDPLFKTAGIRTDTPVISATPFSTGFLSRLATDVPSLPLVGSQVGNVFHDASSPTLAWYLPSFSLAAEVDPTFAFAAQVSDQQVDSAGNYLAIAMLTFGVDLSPPADVATFQKQNPSVRMQLIPLEGLSATLTLSSANATTGAPTSFQVQGTFTPGTLGRVQFTALAGSNVLIAYGNLMGGGANVTLRASYWVARRTVIRMEAASPSAAAPAVAPAVAVKAAVMPQPALRPMARVFGFTPARPVAPTAGSRAPTPAPLPHWPVPQPHPVFGYIRTAQPYVTTLAVNRKFAALGYASRYTVKAGATTRVIAGLDDLKDYDTRQSEFREFTAIGDVSLKYPSFSRLYAGALSRTIVAIPAKYGIVRGAQGTDANCAAVLDVNAAGAGACKFQFSFTLGPVIDPIALVQLARDVAATPSASDCTLALPTQLDAKGGSTLTTAFQGTAAFDVGAAPNTFVMTVAMTDRDGTLPAVAVANQFIQQLLQTTTGFLLGKIRLRLDDAYPAPVEAPFILNFEFTSGSDELALDVTAGGIGLTNQSPLDLQVRRYALVSPRDVHVVPDAQSLSAKQRVALSPSPVAADTDVLVDCTLALNLPLTKTEAARYLAFTVTDVQNVQYQIAVSAAGVNFARQRIASIDVGVTLDDLPEITVPSFSLVALNQAGNEQIFLPIQNAIGSLNATVGLTAHSMDANVSPLAFTLTNDFFAQPVLLLLASNVPPFADPVTPPTDPNGTTGDASSTPGQA